MKIVEIIREYDPKLAKAVDEHFPTLDMLSEVHPEELARAIINDFSRLAEAIALAFIEKYGCPVEECSRCEGEREDAYSEGHLDGRRDLLDRILTDSDIPREVRDYISDRYG